MLLEVSGYRSSCTSGGLILRRKGVVEKICDMGFKMRVALRMQSGHILMNEVCGIRHVICWQSSAVQ